MTLNRKAFMIGSAFLAASFMAMPAFANETETEPEIRPDINVDTELTDGIMTIRIKSDRNNPDFYWESYEGDKGDASYVELVTQSDMEDGYAYVGSFRAIPDASDEEEEDLIRLVYTDGHYVKEYMDFNVTTKDGEILEEVGGGQAFATTGSDLAPFLEGVWEEKDGTHTMEVSLTDDDGLAFTISDGSGKDGQTAYYTMTGYYDCIKDALVYWDGTEHVAAISDGTGETENETEAEAGTGTGLFALDASYDEKSEDLAITLLWKDDTFGNTEVNAFTKAD